MNLVYPGFSQLEWKALTLIGVVPLARKPLFYLFFLDCL